jgi:HD-like signal output (HDOD) protein/DNA-binding response OmpR family regulator
MARVLIIDDDELTRLAVAFALEKSGCEVLHCGDPKDGLRQLAATPVDVLLLDMEMTPTDGVHCLMAIRADEKLKGIPVIMVSASPQREVVTKVARLGVRALVVKSNGFVQELVRRVTALSKPEPAPTPMETAAAERESKLGAACLMSEGPAHVVAGEEVQGPVHHVPMETAAAMNELKALRPVLSRQELLDRVLSGNDLKAMGPAARQVLSLASNSAASVDAVSKAIRQDQAMSLRILKLANSSLYRRGAPVDTVGKAVARIGIEQIRHTVLSMSVLEHFGTAAISGRIRPDWFWEHGIATGLFAAGIARARGANTEQIDSLFTAGLLHDVGRMLFTERLGDVYAGVLDVADRLELPLESVESRLLLINHADLTDRLLREWTFPADMIYPIAYHHLSVGNVRSLAPKSLPEIATLGLANRLAHACALGTSGNDVLYPLEEFITTLGLKDSVIADLCQQVPEHTLDMRVTMMAHGSTTQSSAADTLRGQLGPDIRAITVALRPDTFAARWFLQRLGALDGAEPNVIVARVAHPAERPQVLDLIRRTEAEFRASGLPVLVLGMSTSCFFAEGALGARRVEQLATPLRLERILRSLSALSQPLRQQLPQAA